MATHVSFHFGSINVLHHIHCVLCCVYAFSQMRFHRNAIIDFLHKWRWFDLFQFPFVEMSRLHQFNKQHCHRRTSRRLLEHITEGDAILDIDCTSPLCLHTVNSLFSLFHFYAPSFRQLSNVCRRFAAMQSALYEEIVCILHARRVVIACIIHITAGNGLICWGKAIGKVSRVPTCAMWMRARTFRQNVIVLNLRFACEREMINL